MYPFELCDILPHYEVFLTSQESLSFGLNSSGIKSVCSICLGFLLNSVCIFMEPWLSLFLNRLLFENCFCCF